MPIIDLFSKRQKRLRGDISDIYTYDTLPHQLRVQIVYIIKDAVGSQNHKGADRAARAYKNIHEMLCREYGRFSLKEKSNHDDETQVLNFLLQAEDVEEVIDVVEICFKYLDRVIRNNPDSYFYYTEIKLNADEAIEELNDRFKEHGVGYSFTGGEIIRIDSTYIHSEVTKPTISLLTNRKFQGANEEYLKAHEHYRHGRNKECLTDCLKAFESTMKIICEEKGWSYNETDTARKLVQVCFQHQLVPSFTQNQFTSLQNLLESGIPPIRNKLGGHGQGQIPQLVDDGITRYGLNLTGANIIFLIEQSGIE